MSDFNVPINTTHVNSVLGFIQNRGFDLATMSDTRSTAPTNFPLWTKRWNATNQTFEVNSGGAFTALTLATAGGGTGATVVSSARTNLGVETAYNHVSSTGGVHGAVSAATASQLVVRDGSGRAAFVDPSASGDAATKNYVDTALSYLSLPAFKNLYIKSVADNQSVDIDADYVVMMNTTGGLKIASAVNLTVDLDVSAAINGRDAGSVAANQAWYLYVISNGSTTAGLASESPSAPTMPGGYTYKALVGWCTTDETTTPFNIEEFYQVDNEFWWVNPIKIIDTFYDSGFLTKSFNLGYEADGVRSSGGTTPGTACSFLAAVVPAGGICADIMGSVYFSGGNGVALMHPLSFADNVVGTYATAAGYAQVPMWATSYAHPWILRGVYTAQTFYLQVGQILTSMWVSGFRLKR